MSSFNSDRSNASDIFFAEQDQTDIFRHAAGRAGIFSCPVERDVLCLRIPLANGCAMSSVRDDASPVVVAQGTMGIGLASSLLKPNRFVPIVGCIPERDAWLDPA